MKKYNKKSNNTNFKPRKIGESREREWKSNHSLSRTSKPNLFTFVYLTSLCLHMNYVNATTEVEINLPIHYE